MCTNMANSITILHLFVVISCGIYFVHCFVYKMYKLNKIYVYVSKIKCYCLLYICIVIEPLKYTSMPYIKEIFILSGTLI